MDVSFNQSRFRALNGTFPEGRRYPRSFACDTYKPV